MPNVNFYLKKPEGKPPRSLIYLQFTYSGKKLIYSFGQNIDGTRVKANNKRGWQYLHWDEGKQRVKQNQQTTADGQFALNGVLDTLEQVCKKAYLEELKNGIPPMSALKFRLDAFMNQNEGKDEEPKIYALFDLFISGEIKSNKGKDKSSATLKSYKTTKGHLKAFDIKYKYHLNFDNIDLSFFYKYTTFLKNDIKLKTNSIGKDITILKTVLGEAVDLKYTTNMQFKHKKFTYGEEETDAIYLTEKEIIALYNFDFRANKRLEQVRDLFIFGCFVGLRYSDYSDVKPESIVEIEGDLFIKLITKKTKDLVIIPCNPLVLQIFEKYKDNPNKLPKALSGQKFNEYIKEACKLSKLFNEKGRLSTAPTLELWECVSSHTARRSMATNYYLEGFPTIDLMKITGHKTEKAFLRYIRVTKLDTAKRLSAHIKKNWSQKILRVA